MFLRFAECYDLLSSPLTLHTLVADFHLSARWGRERWYEDQRRLTTKFTIHRWQLRESARSIIPWLWVCNDLKLLSSTLSLMNHAQRKQKVGVCSRSCKFTSAYIWEVMSFSIVNWGHTSGKGPLLVVHWQGPTSNARQRTSDSVWPLRLKYYWRNSNAHTDKKSEILCRGAKWWWRTSFWMFWRTSSEVGPTPTLLNCLQHAGTLKDGLCYSRTCWVPLLNCLRYDVSARSCNDFSTDDALFEGWPNRTSLGPCSFGKISVLWGSTSKEWSYVRNWKITVSLGWLRSKCD